MTETPPPRIVAFPFGLIALAFLFTVLMGAGILVQPSPLRVANAAHQFDATAAQARLARILGDEAPHPVDSAAQDPVRERLLTEIRALGLAPQVREHFSCRPQPRGPLIDCAMVRNIIFSIGPESAPAILAATHYDSVPAAPGASDAGVGIAVWLEVARVLADAPLQRRVIFLISDGEEPALLGAHAFANGDPLMSSVEALVNLEARGTRGPAVFFESNQPNADAVHAFAAAPRGIANSVMADVYALLSNSTDVTALTRPDLDVVNIALLEGLENYHTPQDSLASFSARSAQHMGDIALATTRAFAAGPDRGDASSRVYTDIASRAFVSAPAWAAQAALALSLIVAAVTFWRAGAQGRWRAFATPFAVLAAAGLSAAAIGFGLGALRPGETSWFAQPEWTRAWCALAALAAIPFALMLTRAPRNAGLISAASMLWFALIGFAASFFLAGVSILFAIPAAAYAAFAAIGLVWKPAPLVGAALAAALTLLIWAPTLFLIELALGFEFPFANAVLMALVGTTWLGVLTGLQRSVRWRSSAIVLGGAVCIAVASAAMAPAASAARPMPLNISYFVDASRNEARVIAGGAARPLPPEIAAAANFSPHMLLPGDSFPSWAAPADVAPAPTPTLTDIMVATEGGERIVRAHLVMDGAYRATLRIPRTAAPLRATINGVTTSFADTGGAGEYLNVACQGRACDSASVEIAFDRTGAATHWFMIGQTPAAPAPPADAVRAARPAETTPIQFGDSTITLSQLRPFD
ncbi:MAG: M28 family peptidase [Phycisphaerales bacterium]|nr:M28 family peptidase [Hyphomonadaceae bacterium]